MCFSSKPKVAKTNPDSLKAPEPVMAEEPKGVEFGQDDTELSENIGTEGLKVTKEEKTGEGTQSAVAKDTGTTSKAKSRNSGSIRRAIR